MYQYKFILDRVVDGDTVDGFVDLGFDVRIKTRVRLEGVDTPEIRTKNQAEKKRGLISKQFVEDFFKTDAQIIVHTNLDDKYGRVLGSFYNKEGQSLNQELLAEGLAKPYHNPNG